MCCCWWLSVCALLLLANRSRAADNFILDVAEAETALTAADFERAQYIVDRLLETQVPQPYRLDLFEGDIADAPVSGSDVAAWVAGNGIRLWTHQTGADTDDGPKKHRNAVRSRYKLWTGGQVPYVISSRYSSHSRSLIAWALQQLSSVSCVRLVPRQRQHTSYLSIVPGDGCYSSVGMQGGKQIVSLGAGCLQRGVIMHELLHAIGFFHEQSRPDRDQYVQVVWANILPGMWGQFDKYSRATLDDMGAAYDYESIMHYGPYAFSSNGRATIRARRSSVSMGQRRALTATDIYKLNRLYGCATSTTATATVQQPQTAQRYSRCADTRNDCWQWRAYCQTHSWLRQACQATCGACSAYTAAIVTTTTTTTTTQHCADRQSNCIYYHNLGYCTLSARWMARECSKTCGFCAASPTAPVLFSTTTSAALAACQDTYSGCALYRSLGYCQTQQASGSFMVDRCSKSCGLCRDDRYSLATTTAWTEGTFACADRLSSVDCASRVSLGMCHSAASWMHSYCRRACQWCSSSSTDAVDPSSSYSSCVDRRSDCAQLASAFRCATDASHMRQLCARSCQLCPLKHQLRQSLSAADECHDRRPAECSAALRLNPSLCLQSTAVQTDCPLSCGRCSADYYVNVDSQPPL